MDRLRRSWSLATESWAVLARHRSLLVVPVLAAVVSVGVAIAAFLGATRASVSAAGRAAAGGWSWVPVGVGGWVLLVVGYLVAVYVAVFARAALVHGASDALAGSAPTLRSMLRGAGAHAGALVPWAVLTATVGAVLRGAPGRSAAGRAVGSLLGAGWSVATMLVVPFLVLDGVGLRTASTRSGAALRVLWGEQLAGYVGLGAVTAAATLLGAVLSLPGFVLGAWLSRPGVALAAVVALGVWCLCVAVVSVALGAVYRAALHRAVAPSVDGRTAQLV